MAVTFLITTLSATVYAAEIDYPNRPIGMIITYPAGGPTDTGARMIQPPLQTALGVSIIITSKGGVGGALGTDFVVKSKPDGYTIGVTSCSSLTYGPVINPSLPYKYNDVLNVCVFMRSPMVIASRADAPWKNFDELVDYAKKNPGKLNYASPGLGSIGFFTMEIFKIAYGLDIVSVGYQGSGPATTALLGGHVDLGAVTFDALLSQFKAGKLNPLAISNHMDGYPNIPTTKEKGFPEAKDGWMSLFVSSNVPKYVVERLGREMEKIMKDPAIISQFKKNWDYRRL